HHQCRYRLHGGAGCAAVPRALNPVTIRRLLVLATLGVCALSTAHAQAAASSPATTCAEMLNALNPGLQARRAEALLAAATLHEIGRCVDKSEVRAAEYLSEAAKGGNKVAAVRLARKFARGWGVAQSYAMAGAWVTGKGSTDEKIEAWDYSIGYASAVLRELLAAARYPTSGTVPPAAFSFVVEIDALNPSRLAYRVTSAPTEGSAALSDAVERVLRSQLVGVLGWLPPADRRLMVSARVAVPVTLRYVSATEIAAYEGDAILR
ncbi:MAG: hypothetical protein ABI702_17900, partial [Burkholderiales bacterium]